MEEIDECHKKMVMCVNSDAEGVAPRVPLASYSAVGKLAGPRLSHRLSPGALQRRSQR